MATQCAIDERTIDIVLQRLVLRGGQTAAKWVGVVGRCAYKGQQVTGPRIQYNRCATVVAQRDFGCALNFGIDAGNEIGAGRSILVIAIHVSAATLCHFPALSIHNDLPVTDTAMQLIFERALHPQFSHMRRSGIVGSADAGQIDFADGTNITERVHYQFIERVVPGQRSLYIDTRKMQAFYRKVGEIFFVQGLAFDFANPARIAVVTNGVESLIGQR